MAEKIIDFIMDNITPWIVALTLIGLIFLIPLCIYSFYINSQKQTFELKKDEWICTQNHETTSTTYVMSGKVLIPIITTSTDCMQWSHK